MLQSGTRMLVMMIKLMSVLSTIRRETCCNFGEILLRFGTLTQAGVTTSVSMDLRRPTYLADALQPVAGPPGRQRLRSSSTSALAVPMIRLSTIGDRRLHSVCEQLKLNSRLILFSAYFP